MGQASGRIVAGVDVHKRSTRIAAVEGDRLAGEVTVSSDPRIVEEALRRLGVTACCYEAGPTGYGLYRYLNERGLVCEVIAPGLVWRQPGDRVKTDPRDARRLGGAVSGWDAASDSRALTRARGATGSGACARGRSSRPHARAGSAGQVLASSGPRDADESWSLQRRTWLGQQSFEEPAARAAFDDYLMSVDLVDRRIDTLEQGLAEQALAGPYAELVARLRCLRGIDTLSAVGLAAEIGDFTRFASAQAFMSFVGLVPTEHSSGTKRTQGSITKAGNDHARRLLVEAAWNHRRRPGASYALQRRRRDQHPLAVARALRAERDSTNAGTGYAAAATTSAQSSSRSPGELAGFAWATATDQPLQPTL